MAEERPRLAPGPARRTPAKAPLPLDERAAPRQPRNRAAAPPPLARPVKSDRPSRFTLAWRRQRRLLRPAGLTIVLAVLVFAGFTLVRQVQPGSTVANWRERVGNTIGLQVQQIVIEGRDKTPEPMLRAALGVNPGDKLLGFSLEAARARIEALAWVQSATVERRLPGTIVVALVERRPFAVWQSKGKFVLIDRQGQVVAEQDPVKDATAFTSLPLVVGDGAPEAAADLLDQLATHPAIRARVVAAVRVGERRWNLHLQNGADVLLPEGAAPQALAKLQELQDTQQLLDRPLQTVDMRLADRLVVRPAPESKPAATSRRPT
jgi:cell division protein FtsQ